MGKKQEYYNNIVGWGCIPSTWWNATLQVITSTAPEMGNLLLGHRDQRGVLQYQVYLQGTRWFPSPSGLFCWFHYFKEREKKISISKYVYCECRNNTYTMMRHSLQGVLMFTCLSISFQVTGIQKEQALIRFIWYQASVEQSVKCKLEIIVPLAIHRCWVYITTSLYMQKIKIALYSSPKTRPPKYCYKPRKNTSVDVNNDPPHPPRHALLIISGWVQLPLT